MRPICVHNTKQEGVEVPNEIFMGGNQINFTGKVVTSIANMLVAKLLFNSVVSTKSARFMTINISNFYLNTPLKWPKNIHIKLSDISVGVIDKCKLQEKANKHGNVYAKAT